MISILNTPTHNYYKQSADCSFGVGVNQDWESDWYDYNKINNVTINKERFLIPITINYDAHNLLQGERYFRLGTIHQDLLNNGQGILLFDYSMENYLHPETLQIIRNTIDRYNLNNKNSLFCSMYYKEIHNLNTCEFNYCKYVCPVLEDKHLIELESNFQRSKKILTYCRKFTDFNYRYDFGEFVYKNDYQHQNIVTMPEFENPLTDFEMSLPWLYDFLLNEERLDKNKKVTAYNDAYNNTFISFILETYFDFDTSQNFVDVSEKFSNAVRHLHPFIIHSRPGYLKYIKKLGYKTFDKWWDESYDDIENNQLRKRMLYSIYSDLNKRTLDELADMRKEMLPILKHNCELYNKNKSNHTYFDNLFEKIRVCFSSK